MVFGMVVTGTNPLLGVSKARKAAERERDERLRGREEERKRGREEERKRGREEERDGRRKIPTASPATFA